MQQEPQTQHQLTALAVVIESSLAVAQEWPNPLFQYCMHLFKRINEGYHPAKLRGAFVGYGTIDTVPSPILCKRFFTENTMVFREIFEEPMHFGIGMTNSGGARGMAALEGLVAALEMFDDLQKLPNTKICGSFILHIAASAPDSSLRPEWNDSELMDGMTWEAFPAEFKKRNIGYNLLTLRPPKGRLAELYDATNTNADASLPWFDLKPLYTLSAASIASLQPVKAINKRQNEVPPTTEPPENKRPRLQPTAHESPKPMLKVPPAPPSDPPLPVQPSEPDLSPQSQSQSQPQALSQPQSQTQAPTQPATPPVAQQAAHPPSQIPSTSMQQLPVPPGNPTPEELLERFATATEVMRKYEMGIHAAVAAGDMARAEARRVEYEKRKPQYERLKSMVHYYRLMSAMKQNSVQPTNDVGVPLGSGDIMPTGNTNPVMLPQSVAIAQPQTNSQINEIHPSTSSIDTAIPDNPNPNIQMQKIMEQNQTPSQPGSNVAVGGVSPNPSMLPFATGGESVVGMAGTSTEPRHSRPAVEWTGSLKWSGQGPNGTREMQCVVTVASALAPEKAHTEMWPEAMELIPVDKIPMIQLQEWIKKQQTCLCSFKALSTESDQASYAVLMQLFDSVFAVASWTVPSGTHPTRNAIFFPYHQRTTSFIAGAIFPLTGIPDTLPKAIPQQMGGTPLSGPSLPPSMPQAMIQALKAMSPAERQQFMAQWFMRHNLVRQQQQQQASELAAQQGSGISSFNPNMQLSAGNQASGLNMMGGVPPQGNFMMNQNFQGGHHMLSGSVGGTAMVPGAPTGGNMSYEALQSLMQRNAGNGMNMGQNMGL